jgi:hypothetical protein
MASNAANQKYSQLSAASPPIKENEVVITFLGDKYVPDSVIDLGVHLMDKSLVTSESIPAEGYTDITQYKFVEHGFETLIFDEDTRDKLTPIYEISRSLTPSTPSPPDELDSIQSSIDILQNWMKRVYAEKTGNADISVICSRHLILRIAGCSDDSCHIPGNPLIHLDYINFDRTYERQCEEQEKHPIPVACPPKENLIDVVNVWFPTEEINDWPLGFLDIKSVDVKDYVPIQLVVGSHAASIRYKDNLKVIYKKNMKDPEVYMFRSATGSDEKKGLLHGSFRITPDSFQRKSVELRCLIFKNSSKGGGRKYKRYISRKSKAKKRRHTLKKTK